MTGIDGIDDFTALVRDELGLPLTDADIGRKLDDLPGWDSMHLLWLITALERSFGRTLSFPRVLEATTLEEIYELAVAG
ncbi:MAG TPA: acyl carrier protein [Streptomyces sp.]